MDQKNNRDGAISIKSWCNNVNEQTMLQAKNLSIHPIIKKHVVLMPDCHIGYGMPIGGIIACDSAVIPSAVGVDIGCGMIAVETNISADLFSETKTRRNLLDSVKVAIPLGEGHSHKKSQNWAGFEKYSQLLLKKKSTAWPDDLDRQNLGSLGGGNHFIELQKSEKNKIWLMLHSGSRNLGYKIARFYAKLALKLNKKWNYSIPCSDLAFLPANSIEGKNYIRDMNFALKYAFENRLRMMNIFKEKLYNFLNGKIDFLREVNIHHNYAAIENHFQKNYWIHRKGATSAKTGEIGIIPGSMGTPSYIVKGKGNPESFMSCSHGAGRCLGRRQANERLTVDECDKAMHGIVFDRWKKSRFKRQKNNEKKYDLSESPLAYKNIEDVINSQLDLVKPIVKLFPLAGLKG
jgi:tRNA-splicing ligase RtcB (3'-phosphate/5'-hydroxy nucleic acid ligase)